MINIKKIQNFEVCQQDNIGYFYPGNGVKVSDFFILMGKTLPHESTKVSSYKTENMRTRAKGKFHDKIITSKKCLVYILQKNRGNNRADCGFCLDIG